MARIKLEIVGSKKLFSAHKVVSNPLISKDVNV